MSHCAAAEAPSKRAVQYCRELTLQHPLAVHSDGSDGGRLLLRGEGVQVAASLCLQRPADLLSRLVAEGGQPLQQLRHLSGEQAPVLGTHLGEGEEEGGHSCREGWVTERKPQKEPSQYYKTDMAYKPALTWPMNERSQVFSGT